MQPLWAAYRLGLGAPAPDVVGADVLEPGAGEVAEPVPAALPVVLLVWAAAMPSELASNAAATTPAHTRFIDMISTFRFASPT
jgi:hypothetical protein